MRFCSCDCYASLRDVRNVYSWAAMISKTEGGWLVFDTMQGYLQYKKNNLR